MYSKEKIKFINTLFRSDLAIKDENSSVTDLDRCADKSHSIYFETIELTNDK